MINPLSGKKVLLTGASSGIGKATAQAMFKHGAHVIGVSRNANALPEEVKCIQADLTRRKDIERIFEGLGSIDALVNCAGVAYLSRITDGNPEDWEEMWRVNVFALTLCSQLALTHFPEGAGRIVNVSSMSGHRVPPTGGFYSPTKFAVRAVTDALRLELKADGSSVQVGCVSPGFVDTPLLNLYFKGREDVLEETRESVPMLQPEDVALAIVEILEKPQHVDIGDVIIRA